MRFSIDYSCVSHIGKCREINQDNFVCNGYYKDPGTGMYGPDYGRVDENFPALFAVFDGMGGESCGEIASYIAAKTAADTSIGSHFLQSLSDYCKNANRKICEYAKNNGVSSMGTTAALLAFTKEGIGLCNVGDTKIFRFSENCLSRISKDHIITSSYYEKPILTQNLGISEEEKPIEPFFAKGRYKDGDMFIICSDGLTNMVSRLKMEMLLNHNPYTDVIETLLDMALDRGGSDDITIIVCKIDLW